MSVNKNPLRHGNFTSSECYHLLSRGKKESFSKPGLDYIKEKNMERLLGRSLFTDTKGKPILWGKLLESRAFDLLGLEYTLCSDVTVRHPTIPFWAGSADGYKENTVDDLKCPFTLKSFCQLVQPLYEGQSGAATIQYLREYHTDGEKYYQQLVSNSVLLDKQYAELIVYMPYESEIPAIKMMAEGDPSYYWLTFAQDDDLPYLIDGGYYKNINIIRFEVPEHDKRILTERILEAGEYLLGNKTITEKIAS